MLIIMFVSRTISYCSQFDHYDALDLQNVETDEPKLTKYLLGDFIARFASLAQHCRWQGGDLQSSLQNWTET